MTALSYQVLPILIFLLAIFAAILMVLRRLPEATRGITDKTADISPTREKLWLRGLPAQGFSKTKHYAVFWLKRIWRFMLEAKEMAPTGTSVLKIKKLFSSKAALTNSSLAEETNETQAVKLSEDDYLAAIKKEPKNFIHYDNLGKLYLERANFQDARDLYLHLTSHASGNFEYWARLGFACFKLKDFKRAVEGFEKSIALDSSQPNRYYNLAQSLRMDGQNRPALKAINQALAMDPENFKFLELKGRIERNLGT